MNRDVRRFRVAYLIAGTSIARSAYFVALNESQARLQARSWFTRQSIRASVSSVVAE